MMISNTYFVTFFVISFNLYAALGKLPSLKTNGQTSKRLDECRACNVLTESFSHWLDQTSRGKFEGGDADWEENKLKSYSRSEVRLVEIQEGLCSELKKHKDECYSLAEEAEQPIEQWWVDNEPADTDLYTWLCIDTLAHCCPSGHFGPNCKRCPHNSNDQLCGGRGKCNGEGTRKGTGKCRCIKGYVGEACLQCATGYYRVSNELDLHECEECDVSCLADSGCDAAGPGGCRACANGWNMTDAGCVDMDECALNDVCAPQQYCANTLGSYQCFTCHESCASCTGPDPSACTRCNPGYTRSWSGACSDTWATYLQLLVVASVVIVASAVYMFRMHRIFYAIIISFLLISLLHLSGYTTNYNNYLHQGFDIERILNLFHYR